MFEAIILAIFSFIVGIISGIGYLGIFILMALESMITPIPSELVMPFAGFLVSQGKLSLVAVILAGTLGSLAGSLISYYTGYFGGRPFVLKVGRYLLLHESDLRWTEGFFRKHGEKTIFICRFIPAVRHVISIPSGVGKMDIKKFSAYTFAGSLIWVSILTYSGILLEDNWKQLYSFTEKFDIIVIVFILILIGIFVRRHIKRK